MKIRNLMLALVAGLTLTNCAEDVEKLAKPYLTRAQQSHANKQYALAKLQIDSIKQLYPKAFNTRTQAQARLIEVELTDEEIAERLKDFCPKLHPDIKRGFVRNFIDNVTQADEGCDMKYMQYVED